MTFEYAQLKDYIDINPMTYIPWKLFNKQNFVEPEGINLRGYTIEELSRMLAEAQAMQLKNPADARPWAYELTLYIGGRRAEIPPLNWDDTDEQFIYLWKQLVGSYPYTIKGDPKNKNNRAFPMTPVINDYLYRLKENNSIYHPDSNFLFPNEKQPSGCISLGGVYKIHEKICKKLGIPISKDFIKGTHAFRRVHETEFIGETGSSKLSEEIYGHTEKTVDEHYRMKQAAEVTAPTVLKIQNKIISGCTRVHTQNEEKEKPET